MSSRKRAPRSNASAEFGIEFSAMASACEVRLAAASPGQAKRIAQVAIDEVRRIEFKYSRYRADSIVGRINAAAGDAPIDCDAETAQLLDYANTLYNAADGLFDITSGVLRRAWDFKAARLPEPAVLEQCLRLIGWRRVHRETSHLLEAGGQRVSLAERGMEIDFGGFGKEYAADRAAAALLAVGVTCGFVNLGGDIRVLGPRLDGSAWTLGVQDPRDPERMAASVSVHGGALATSGDYERFFELEGRRYCHILNPRTGWPVQGLRSVTVQAPLAIAAGSCTTIAMLKGSSAKDFLDATGFEYLAIDWQGRRL